MLTIKLPFTCSQEDSTFIKNLQEIYSPLIRTAYNRSMGKMKEKEIRHAMSKFGKLDSWFVQSSVKEGMTLAATDLATERKSRIFGGKRNFLKRTLGKITKTNWKELRIQPLPICGEACKSGNRKFTFDIIDSNTLIFKANKDKHIRLQLPKLRKNLLKTLCLLEMASNDDVLAISIKLTSTHICITYDEIKLNQNKTLDLIETRHAGIDLNPNYIGMSINENKLQIKTELYDLKFLTKKSGETSSHYKSCYLNNKLDFETIEIANDIVSVLKFHQVSTLTLEDLKFSQGDKNLGKNFNRLTLNVWKRNIFINQLIKRCKLIGIKVILIHPAYTSFIGNLQNNYPDPVSSSVEISRRGYETQGKKSEQFYPVIKLKDGLENLWKKDLGQGFLSIVSTWKELFAVVKKSKLKYRVPIPLIGFRNMSSKKSLVYKSI